MAGGQIRQEVCIVRKGRIAVMVILALAMLMAFGSAPGYGAPAKKIRIAMLMASTIDDMAWSQSMYDGLKAVQKEFGADKIAAIQAVR